MIINNWIAKEMNFMFPESESKDNTSIIRKSTIITKTQIQVGREESKN